MATNKTPEQVAAEKAAKKQVAAAKAEAKKEAAEDNVELIDGSFIGIVENPDGTRTVYGEDNGEKMLLASGEYRSASRVYIVGDDGKVIEEAEAAGAPQAPRADSDVKTGVTGADQVPDAGKVKALKDPLAALVAQYKKAYPKNGELHITTDGQVFLAADKNLAQLHQRGLGGNGEVKTYKTK